MATYVIVFKKPKKPGENIPPEDKKPVTSIKDYQDITKVFKSRLLASNKAICSHNVDGDEMELIYNKTLENKKKVCFTGLKFTGNTLRREVPVDKLDKDTVVYFIDHEEVLQNVINKASDGDVISLIDSVEIHTPLTCDGKKVEIDLCGCDINCAFDGEATTSPNITIKNSIEGMGVISKAYSSTNKGEVHVVDPVSQSAAEVVAAAAPGDIVVLPAGEYGDISTNNGITIAAQYNAETKTYDEVVLSGKVTVAAESGTVELNHVKLANNTSTEGTGSGKNAAKGSAVSVAGSCDVQLKDCTVENMNNFYNVIKIDTTGKVVIDGVTFGKNSSYNGIEFGLNTLVGNGTTIKNCTFEEGCMAHCAVSMYAYEDGAVVNFIGNILETDDNQFRFSNSNNANVTINMTDNVWKKTEAYDATAQYNDGRCTAKFYAGLFFFQQYIETMDLSKITVNAKNNKFNDKVVTAEYTENAEEQLFYTYMDKTAWVMTRPTVNILQ